MPSGGRHDNDDDNSPQLKKQQSPDDGVPFWCGRKWRGRQGRWAKRRKTTGRECNGANPPIDKNWWGDLTTMMTKIWNKQTADDGGW
jgi:hypothetical protein